MYPCGELKTHEIINVVFDIKPSGNTPTTAITNYPDIEQ